MRFIHLSKKTVRYIKPITPFNFDGTVFAPAHFSEPDFEWRKDIVWQTMNFDNKLLGIKMEDKGTTLKPKIKLTIYFKGNLTNQEIKNITSELNWRYGLNENISKFIKEFKSDKFLKLIFRKWKGMRINCANSLYELTIIAIVLQNATVRRTVQMMNNLLNAFGTKLKFDKKELFAFWSPSDLDKVTEGDLRSLKVGYRAKMIKKVSESFAKGEVNEFVLREIPIEEARKEIMKLYGVGPATAQILLGEYLRKYGIFDLEGRFWEQKILSRILFGKRLVPTERIIKELDKRYGKWKGLAFHYLFQDLFWRHREKKIDWLEREIRL